MSPVTITANVPDLSNTVSAYAALGPMALMTFAYIAGLVTLAYVVRQVCQRTKR